MGCKGSDEQRYNRYKEIGLIIKELRMVANGHSLMSPTTPASSKFNHDSPGGSSGKKHRKEQKGRDKVFDRAPIIKEKDIRRIGEILHPDEPADEDFGLGLRMPKRIEDNIYYHPATASSRGERNGFLSQDRSGKSASGISDAQMGHVLVELKVPDLSQIKNKKERDLVNRLREKIAEDFVHDEHEAQEIAKREASFWRWANRKAYDRRAANARIEDWKNGDELARIPEHVNHEGAPEAAGIEEAAANDEGEAAVDRQSTSNGTSDDQSSVVSLTSEESRSRPALSSSVSRATSLSSISRTTMLSTQVDNSSSEEWTTVKKSKSAKGSAKSSARSTAKASATRPNSTLKLSLNGGEKHLEPVTPRTPSVWATTGMFSGLSIERSGEEHESDDDDALSPRTPCPKRR